MPTITHLAGVFLLVLLVACGDAGTAPEIVETSSQAERKVDLVRLIEEVRELMPGRDSEGYIPPRPAETMAFLAAVDRAIAGDFAGADVALEPYGYNCEAVIEAGTGDSLVIFRERSPVRRGWGTFVWNRAAGVLPVDVHVNHPIHDEQSEVIGAALYRGLRGRWLFIAGTHRYANRAGNSDMAREPESLFQTIYQHVAGGARHTISLHGFSAAAHPEPVASTQVILSSGKSSDGIPVTAPSAVALQAHLQRASLRTGLYSLDPGFDSFAGSLNPQGRFSNTRLGTDRWIHVELAREIRRDRARWEALNERIAGWALTTFPADT